MALDFPTPTLNTFVRPSGGMTFRADGTKWRHAGSWQRLNYFPPVGNNTSTVVPLPADVVTYRLTVLGLCPGADDYIYGRFSIDNGASYVTGTFYRFIIIAGGANGFESAEGTAMANNAQFMFCKRPVIANSTYPNYWQMYIEPLLTNNGTYVQWHMYTHAQTVGPVFNKGFGFCNYGQPATHFWILSNYGMFHRGILLEGIRRGD